MYDPYDYDAYEADVEARRRYYDRVSDEWGDDVPDDEDKEGYSC